MKTAVISDIHLECHGKYNIFDELGNYLRENEIELLIIAGDIETDYFLSEMWDGMITAMVPTNTVLRSMAAWRKTAGSGRTLSGTLGRRTIKGEPTFLWRD